MQIKFKLSLLLCLSFIFSQQLQAQEPQNRKFGKVADSEVKQASFEAYPEAEAIYLMDIGRTYVTYASGYKLMQERHFRIKVLSEAGQSYADVEIPYYGKDRIQNVTGVKASTYYEDGGDVIEQKIKNSDIFDEDVDGYWRKKKFSMPNVKPGAIIEVRYTLSSDNITYINNWYFQKRIPVMYSMFTREVIEGFYYQTVSKGTVIAIDRSSKRTTQSTSAGKLDMEIETFIAMNIAPLKEEAYVANMDSYASHLTFQLQKISIPGGLYKDYVTNWGEINYAWNKDMADYYKSNGATRDELEKIDISNKEESEKLSEIFHYVQKEFTFNGMTSRYPYPESKGLLKERKGNGTSINYLLLTLLRDAGFEANPCLISTRGNGIVQRIFPTTRQFDHVIVAVEQGEEVVLLDATQKSLPMGMLPYRDLNHEGIILGESGYKWISLQPKQRLKLLRSANFKILPDGSIEGQVISKHEEYSAMIERDALTEVEDRDEYFQDDLTSGFEDAELVEYKVKEEEAIYKPFTTVSNLEINDNVAGSIGDRIYLKPLLDETITENPFTSEKRTYPIDFGFGHDRKIIFSYLLPEGFQVESVPDPIRMTTPDKDFIFQYQAQSVGNMLQIQYILEIKGSYFQAAKYDEIKAFYDQIVKKHGEQIVIKKGTAEGAANN